MKNKNFPQRSKVTYPLNYDPDLLCGLDRAESRKNMYIDENTTKFYGLDSWTAYELSWLEKEGSIENGVLYFSYPCSSKNFIESKSLKLYLNSLNNKHFEDREKVIELLLNDLGKCVSDTVNLEISEKPRDFLPQMISIDHVKIDADSNMSTPNSLVLKTFDQIVKEELSCSTFRSLCPLSLQPDWASISIVYKGRQIDRKSLLIYLTSFRNHEAFHEQCVERIFHDLMKRCKPSTLTVQANYLRRGGIEINPLRTTEEFFDKIVLRQKRQ